VAWLTRCGRLPANAASTRSGPACMQSSSPSDTERVLPAAAACSDCCLRTLNWHANDQALGASGMHGQGAAAGGPVGTAGIRDKRFVQLACHWQLERCGLTS
jgi:hypothetical protein